MDTRLIMERTRQGFNVLWLIVSLPFRIVGMFCRALVAIGNGFVRLIANMYLAYFGMAALAVLWIGVSRLFY